MCTISIYLYSHIHIHEEYTKVPGSLTQDQAGLRTELRYFNLGTPVRAELKQY